MQPNQFDRLISDLKTLEATIVAINARPLMLDPGENDNPDLQMPAANNGPSDDVLDGMVAKLE